MHIQTAVNVGTSENADSFSVEGLISILQTGAVKVVPVGTDQKWESKVECCVLHASASRPQSTAPSLVDPLLAILNIKIR